MSLYQGVKRWNNLWLNKLGMKYWTYFSSFIFPFTKLSSVIILCKISQNEAFTNFEITKTQKKYYVFPTEYLIVELGKWDFVVSDILQTTLLSA